MKPRLLLKKTYLSVIQGSVGSIMFRECHFRIGNKNVDVLENGRLACAFYVSTILKIVDLIHHIHTTVNATETDLIRSGWKQIKKPKIGCIVIYALKQFRSGSAHRHIGFYIGKEKVIDNSSKKGMPQVHRWNYRPVESLWWHEHLES